MRKSHHDRAILYGVLLLLCIGTIMVFSTTTAVFGDSHIFNRHLIFGIAGLVAMAITMRVNYHWYWNRGLIYGILGLSAVLLAGAFFSPTINGVNRWLQLGPFRGQPSELAKFSMIFFTAYYAVEKPHAFRSFNRDLGVYVAVLAGFLVLIGAEPDLGTATVLLLICVTLTFLAGLPKISLLAGVAAAIPAFYLLVYQVPYRRDRILAFLDPEHSPLDVSYQIRQSLIAVGSGGWTGLGLGQSKQKLAYLPEPHNDFIFAIVGEELGFLGSTLLLAVFLFLFWRGIKISLRADSRFGTYLGLGVTSMLVLQALINLSVVLSLLPTKGIPLPFISLGGSSLVVALAAVGVLLNISHHGRRQALELLEG